MHGPVTHFHSLGKRRILARKQRMEKREKKCNQLNLFPTLIHIWRRWKTWPVPEQGWLLDILAAARAVGGCVGGGRRRPEKGSGAAGKKIENIRFA